MFEHLNCKFDKVLSKNYFETLDIVFYRIINNIDRIDSLQIYQVLVNYIDLFLKEDEIKTILTIISDKIGKLRIEMPHN